MKKNILRYLATATLCLSLSITPIFAKTTSNHTTQVTSKLNTELNLLDGTYLSEGVFYNTIYNYTFKIPPVWEDNFTVFQHHTHTIFTLNPETTDGEDFIFSISVFDISPNADVYHSLPNNFEEDFVILHETENLIYAYKIYEKTSNSNIEPSFFEMMQTPLNGVEDLFNIVETSIIAIQPTPIQSFIHEDIYFNLTHGFLLRIPPVWEEDFNFTVWESQSNNITGVRYTTNFLFELENFDEKINLFSIIINQNTELFENMRQLNAEYEGEQGTGSRNLRMAHYGTYTLLAENENFVYEVLIYNNIMESLMDELDSTYYEKLRGPLDGVDDLFYLIETSNIEGIDMIPLSMYANILGYDINWVKYTQTVELSKNNNFFTVHVGNLEYTNNGNVGSLYYAPTIYEDQVFIDLNFLEVLGQ